MPRPIDLESKVDRLRAFVRRENRLPSYREMLPLFGYRSKNAVHGITSKLVEAGFLRRDKEGRYAPTAQLTGSTKLLGAVQAGFPSPAEEELVDQINLDEYLMPASNRATWCWWKRVPTRAAARSWWPRWMASGP